MRESRPPGSMGGGWERDFGHRTAPRPYEGVHRAISRDARDGEAPGGRPGRGAPSGPRRRVAGGGGRRRPATFGPGIAWWRSGRPVVAAVVIRWRPGRADLPVAPRGMSGRGARRGPAPGGRRARAPGSTTSPPPPGASPRAAASAPGATGVARAPRGGSRAMAGGNRRPAPRPRRPPPHRPGPRGWRPRGRRPTRVPAAFDPPSPGASRSRQTPAPSRPDGRASRGPISPSPVRPSDFLSSSFNL